MTDEAGPIVTDEAVLVHQLEYYRARADEYDDWWRRTGRYDRGEEANARWFAEVDALEAAVQHFDPRGRVLELACGTGLWTRRWARFADRVTAVDAAPEVLAINRARLAELSTTEASLAPVEYVEADLFAWEPPAGNFDACVFTFWLSHVPNDRFAAFWERVGRALKPGGRALFIDSQRAERSKSRDHTMPEEGSTVEERRLNDGRTFEIVKRYYAPDALASELAQLGWDCTVESTGEFFIHGAAMRADHE